MKLAIMTWLRNYNYGTALQAFALSKYLTDNNHETSVLDYESFKPVVDVEEKLSLLSILGNRIQNKISMKNGKWNIYQENVNCFEEFINHHIPVTTRITLYSELVDMTHEMDAVICGSDQIWSPTFFDPHFFLDYIDDSNRKIAYAPSFGVTSIKSDYIRNRMKELVRRFKYLSVREKSGQKLVEKEFGCPSEVVVDPVFLIHREQWSILANESKIKIDVPYMVTYFLGDTNEHWHAVYDFAKKNQLKNIIIPVQYSHLKRLDQEYIPISPVDFLKLIRDAEYVCTDSFHATSFSIIFRKQFHCFDRFLNTSSASQNSRIHDLLLTLGIIENVIPFKSKFIKNLNLIDYGQILHNLNKCIADSKQFLESALYEISCIHGSLHESNQNNILCGRKIKLKNSKGYIGEYNNSNCPEKSKYSDFQELLIFLFRKKIKFVSELLNEIDVPFRNIVTDVSDQKKEECFGYFCLKHNIVIGTPCGIARAKKAFEIDDKIYIEVGCKGEIMAELTSRIDKKESTEILFAEKLVASGKCYFQCCYECQWKQESVADLRIDFLTNSSYGEILLFINTKKGEEVSGAIHELFSIRELTELQRERIVSKLGNLQRPVYYEEMKTDLTSDTISLEDIYVKYVSAEDENNEKEKMLDKFENIIKSLYKLKFIKK